MNLFKPCALLPRLPPSFPIRKLLFDYNPFSSGCAGQVFAESQSECLWALREAVMLNA